MASSCRARKRRKFRSFLLHSSKKLLVLLRFCRISQRPIESAQEPQHGAAILRIRNPLGSIQRSRQSFAGIAVDRKGKSQYRAALRAMLVGFSTHHDIHLGPLRSDRYPQAPWRVPAWLDPSPAATLGRRKLLSRFVVILVQEIELAQPIVRSFVCCVQRNCLLQCGPCVRTGVTAFYFEHSEQTERRFKGGIGLSCLP